MQVLVVATDMPSIFSQTKRYELGTGYIALFDPKEETGVLCRYIEKNEEKEMNTRTHYLFDLEEKENSLKGRKVFIITKIQNLEQADAIIHSYQKAFEDLEKLEKELI